LDKLSFVILTHQHEDHLDVDLIRALTHLPITWIVPESVLALIQDKVRLPGERVIIPKDLQPIMLQGIKVTPFTGLHWEKLGDGLKGVPATGYLVEFQNKRWLFPGDTRTYDASRLPDFGPVDGLFAHLWLGRGCAARAEPPLLDAFCRFCLDLKSRRVILTHIHEFGRDINDFWDEDHAEMTRARMQAISPDTAFSINAIGTSVDLS
jgi:L-ascorbate metabolism protein UlaG (beta-lactamase superfamily)